MTIARFVCLVEAHLLPEGLALGHTPLEAHLGASTLTAVDLVSSLVFPHALGDGDLGDALADGQGVGAKDCRDALDLEALGPVGSGVLDCLGVLVGGDIDDLSCRQGGVDGPLVDLQVGDTVFDVLQVAANAELALPKALPPSQQVAPCPWRLDAEFSQLVGGEGEEGLPRGELVGMLLEVATDQVQEGRDVGDEGSRRGDEGQLMRPSCVCVEPGDSDGGRDGAGPEEESKGGRDPEEGLHPC